MHPTEKYAVRNRWTGAVQFEAEITCAPDALPGVKIGLAVRWARDNDADLGGADLSYADLGGADLSYADLSYADLSGANLRGADLSGADLRGADLSGTYLCDADLRGTYLRGTDLRSIKADFFMILALGHREVPALISALRDGRVDGSTYAGECACLVGTLEQAGSTDLPHEASSPAEVWFAPIRKGVKPGDDCEGGFRAAKALEWALEYAARTGLEVEAV